MSVGNLLALNRTEVSFDCWRWGGLGGLEFSRIRLHTLGSEHCAMKADLWLCDPTLAAVKQDSFL